MNSRIGGHRIGSQAANYDKKMRILQRKSNANNNQQMHQDLSKNGTASHNLLPDPIPQNSL